MWFRSIIKLSAGYPYFIQFICREVYDVFAQQLAVGVKAPIPLAEITQKLDTDFFAGRWARLTNRQRELVACVSALDSEGEEFTVQEIVELSAQRLKKGFSASHANQILVAISNAGLVYKNRHGKYSFAVPLLGQFVRRQSLLSTVGRPVYEVSPRGDEWSVTKPGVDRPLHMESSKEAAVQRGLELARSNVPSRVLVKRADGTTEDDRLFG